jgi:putative ABC transport system ATP-binding protein
VISVRGLSHRYGAAGGAAAWPDWRVAQGERWLVPRSLGCGKTTLLHVLAGLVRPSEGQVEVAGENLLKLEGARPRSLARHLRWASCCRPCIS